MNDADLALVLQSIHVDRTRLADPVGLRQRVSAIPVHASSEQAHERAPGVRVGRLAAAIAAVTALALGVAVVFAMLRVPAVPPQDPTMPVVAATETEPPPVSLTVPAPTASPSATPRPTPSLALVPSHRPRLPGCDPVPVVSDEAWATMTEDVSSAIIGRTSAEAETYLSDARLCHEWRYVYRYDRPIDSVVAYSERWCAPPPAGVVTEVQMDRGSKALVWVEETAFISAPRAGKMVDWGCPNRDGTAVPLPSSTLTPADLSGRDAVPRDTLVTPVDSAPRHGGLIVELETTYLLPGQSQRATAWSCTATVCVPQVAHWETTGALRLSDVRGTSTVITADDAVGRPSSISAGTPSDGWTETLAIKPQPGERSPADARARVPETRVVTSKEVLGIGDYAVLTGWQCPRARRAFGSDRSPGTADDHCMPVAPSRVTTARGSGLIHVGTFGPGVLVYSDPAGERLDYPIVFAGVALTYPKGDPAVDSQRDHVVPDLYVRDTTPDRPLLGDLDEDGDVDADDRSIVVGAVAADPASLGTSADLTGDRVVTAADVELIDALIDARAAA